MLAFAGLLAWRLAGLCSGLLAAWLAFPRPPSFAGILSGLLAARVFTGLCSRLSIARLARLLPLSRLLSVNGIFAGLLTGRLSFASLASFAILSLPVAGGFAGTGFFRRALGIR